MAAPVTAILTTTERDELVRALLILQDSHPTIADLLPTLTTTLSKLARAQTPTITVGVHGGQVQWVLGNPFPIRVCDYDGSTAELPYVDERDQRCRMWFEPTDDDWPSAIWKDKPRQSLSSSQTISPTP